MQTAVQFMLEKGKPVSEIADTFHLKEQDIEDLRVSLGLPEQKRKTGKEEARQYIMDMSPSEKRAFFKEIDPYRLWTMAEGNPHSTEDSTVTHILPTPILHLPFREVVKTLPETLQ